MTGNELKRWRQRLRIYYSTLSKMIGMSVWKLSQAEKRYADTELPAYITLSVAAWSLGVRSYNGSEIMLLRPVAERALSFPAKLDFANPMPSVKTAFEKQAAAALDPKR